ncbi:heparinase II/III family protein [Paenibacillus sp. NEAU-GSW1]|uniref:heparinase II/III domain-containing protein n=1 Tax=Paenibacillus sp. NEAU-GSW1 TaxID=2682486 RepID=UPI0012E28951|nr:heparinase II/III family protein [Paenibacillus sp. NEAU-GSW1]MUT68238.1 hypothetical protein [Paenibacillus sp. NEAU-GSW1]
MHIEQLKRIFASGDSVQQLLGDEPKRLRERVMAAAALQPFMEEIRIEAKQALQEPILGLDYSLFKMYSDTGSRKEYEARYFSRRKRLTALGLLAWLEPDHPSYKVELNDIIWSVCDEYTWCLTAHLNGGPEMNSSVNVRLDEHSGPHPSATIDLFAAETAMALAEIAYLHGSSLPPLIHKRIREEVYRRVLRPFVFGGEPYFWESAKHNWSSVCAGSIGAAAIYLLESGDELAAVWSKALPALDCFLSGYKEDGACEEGYGYWQYGFGFFVYAADLLKTRTAGGIDLFANEKVKQIALFQQKAFLDGKHAVNFSDAAAYSGISLGFTHFLHEQYAEVSLPSLELQASFSTDHCFRWAPALRNLIWYREEKGKRGAQWDAASYYLDNAQWFISRHAAGSARFAFAAKGGHNDEPHNHNDAGHFIVYANGKSLLADIGAGQYSADYFGSGRYDILCNSSEGHSVPIINGNFQLPGKRHRAHCVRAQTDSLKDLFQLELSSAYGEETCLQKLEREFVWVKSDKPVLQLNDRFQFESAPASIVERFIAGTPPQFEDQYVLLKSEEAAIAIRYDQTLLQARFVELPHLTHSGEKTTIYAVDFHLLRLASKFELAFQFEWM